MYKILHEGNVVDVVRNPKFIRFLSSGHIAITDKMSAQGIVGSDKTVYSFEPTINHDSLVATIESIDISEFNRLYSLLNSDKILGVAEQQLIKAKSAKIQTLSNLCKSKIVEGFTIVLRDKKNYSFQLTAEDQLNLLSLENQLNTGAETFVYHATGLPCQVFVRDDMKKIIKAYRKHVLYHTTYFNTAKQYINSLTDLDKINSFYYGVDVSGITKDPTLRKILRDGGAN